MSHDRPTAGRPPNRRRLDRPLRAVPPLPAHVAASPDAEEAAAELVVSARQEALAQARLAAEHARHAAVASEKAAHLLSLAALTEGVIRA